MKNNLIETFYSVNPTEVAGRISWITKIPASERLVSQKYRRLPPAFTKDTAVCFTAKCIKAQEKYLSLVLECVKHTPAM